MLTQEVGRIRLYDPLLGVEMGGLRAGKRLTGGIGVNKRLTASILSMILNSSLRRGLPGICYRWCGLVLPWIEPFCAAHIGEMCKTCHNYSVPAFSKSRYATYPNARSRFFPVVS